MSKLYVFGIGGTGSRVLKSLTMLLASGVDCKVDTIVPIIIDPDDSGADKERTVDLMKQYMIIHSMLNTSKETRNQFFRTEIKNVDHMVNFTFPLKDTRDCIFEDFIKLHELDDQTQALMRMLFSEKNLKSDMKVGFKGNPNIGSVVLNQFGTSDYFKDFANGFAEGDRIFIISSIFGGTGASGFPLLLKTLRSDKDSASWNLIKHAKIGAVTVLPYFNVEEDPESGVDSGTFISKTKSALAYYQNNISKNGSIDALYYIGDKVPAKYANHDGGSKQKNAAHFVELAAAMAILDFAATDSSVMEDKARHFEYGLDSKLDANTKITFKDLGPKTKALIEKRLTQFELFNRYLTNETVENFMHQPWSIDNQLDLNFYSSDFFDSVKRVHGAFYEWLKEMDKNRRSFKPFDEDKVKLLYALVSGIEPRRYRGHWFKRNYALFDDILNKHVTKLNKADKKEQSFMEVFFRATEDLVINKFGM